MSLPKFIRNLTAGGNNIKYPKEAPIIKTTITTGIKKYKYFFSDEFNPGEENLTTCQSIKGNYAKKPTNIEAFIAVPKNSVRLV